MAPVFSTSGTGMGLAFDGNNEPVARSQTSVAGRDLHGLSKAERLLGVSDAAGPPHHGLPEWRPRQKKLRNMGSNLNLLTDLKAVISGSSPRSNSRGSQRTPSSYPVGDSRRIPSGLKTQTDQRSIHSDTRGQDASFMSAGNLSSYHYRQTQGAPTRPVDIPDVPELPTRAVKKTKMGKYTEEEQDKIISNLASNGMMSSGTSRIRTKRPRTGKERDDRKNSSSHSRGGSSASKVSNAASSKYSQDQQGRRFSRDRNGSTSSNPQIADDAAPRRDSGRKSSQVLTPRVESNAPGVRMSRMDASPEGERIRTWLNYNDVDSQSSQHTRQDWSAPNRLGTVQESQSAASLHTINSLDTGALFPIQGGPDDWSTVKRHSRQSSVLVRADAPAENQAKGASGKGSKVFYTDLAVESVLALSSSDSESDAESEASALARKRFSLVSNGNETQPTAWSSTASSRSQSRKMSLNNHATSPIRYSFSSDQWSHPMPNHPRVNLSREASGASQEAPTRLQKPASYLRQASPMRQEVDDPSVDQYATTAEESVLSPTGRGPPSSPTLTPRIIHDPQLARLTLITQEATPNPLLEAVRQETRARKSSTASQSSTHSHSKALMPGPDPNAAPSQPPTKPLPMPPLQSPTILTPTVQTPSGDDDNSSVFSFPKPPRVLNKARSRSTDLLSSPSESIAPSFGQGQGPSLTSESDGSDGSNETLKANSLRHKPSTLSSPANETPLSQSPDPSNGLLSPDAAYCGSPFVLEEFSPIRIGFPNHVRQQMQDDDGQVIATTTSDQSDNDLSIATGIVEVDQSEIEAPSYALESEPQAEAQLSPVEIPPRTSSQARPPPSYDLAPPRTSSQNFLTQHGMGFSGPRSAPLAIKTDLSPVPELPSSPPSTARTAPPAVQNHWERALAANFPAIPLPHASTRPLRRFHLPTTSTGSTVTGRSSPSPRMRPEEFETKTMPVRTGTPVGMRSVTPLGMRSATPVGWARSGDEMSPSAQGRGRRHSVTPKNSDGTVNTTRGIKTSKRISTGKGIEPLRLSRIGNAV